MDTLTSTVVSIISKYAIDAGATLAKEAGPVAKETAENLFGKVLQYLRQQAASKAIADGYEKNPTGYKVPLQDQLEAAVQADSSFKQAVAQLVTQFEIQQKAFQPNTQVKVKGGGAAAVGKGATAVGERGVQVGGNVQGPIITGSGNVIHSGRSIASSHTLPPTLAPLRDKLTRYFDKSELKALCFDLGVADDDLPGETRTELAQALVQHCHRRGRLPELIRRCQAERPHVDWRQ
jgi:hypothetical protein